MGDKKGPRERRCAEYSPSARRAALQESSRKFPESLHNNLIDNWINDTTALQYFAISLIVTVMIRQCLLDDQIGFLLAQAPVSNCSDLIHFTDGCFMLS